MREQESRSRTRRRPRHRLRGPVEHRSAGLFPVGSLSRRDVRTQPGVLTPGTNRKDAHREKVEGWVALNRGSYAVRRLRPLHPRRSPTIEDEDDDEYENEARPLSSCLPPLTSSKSTP